MKRGRSCGTLSFTLIDIVLKRLTAASISVTGAISRTVNEMRSASGRTSFAGSFLHYFNKPKSYAGILSFAGDAVSGAITQWNYSAVGVQSFLGSVSRIVEKLRTYLGTAVMEHLIQALPEKGALQGAILRLVVEYPRHWDSLIDESALRQHSAGCLDFHLVRRPQAQLRIRLPHEQTVGSLTPLDLLDLYWRASHFDAEEAQALSRLAGELIQEGTSQRSSDGGL